MSDDLVKQARAIDPLCATQCCMNSHLYGEMADRIEELEDKRNDPARRLEAYEEMAAMNPPGALRRQMENRRLRAALKEIVRQFGDTPGGHMAAIIARAALQGEET